MKLKNTTYLAGKWACMTLMAISLSACGNAFERLGNINKEPDLNPIVNPQARADYQPVSLPMPDPIRLETQPNSLWRQGARSFFKDQRAAQVGDIITVDINISESASLDNTTTRSRTNSENAGLTGLFGLEAELGEVLPDAVDPADIVGLSSDNSAVGAGSVSRSEDITLSVAAIIVQVLPNGNLVLEGRQEVRVNHEVRELFVSGIIRPADISSTNSIDYNKIAEARIAYGGRGYLSDVQQARYGQQALDIILPF